MGKTGGKTTPKYIDANKIQWHSNWLISDDARVYAYMDEVDSIPAADVEEVRHGYWIYHNDDLFPSDSTQECSLCHAEQNLFCDDNYCPNCGAKMDGKERTDGNNDGISNVC